MTAIEQAAKLYASEGLTLSVDIERYLKFGLVSVTPDRLLFARPVVRALGVDHWVTYKDKPDTWYVRLAIGDGCLRWFVQQAPFRLPFFAWARAFKYDDSEPRFFPTDRVTKLIYGL